MNHQLKNQSPFFVLLAFLVVLLYRLHVLELVCFQLAKRYALILRLLPLVQVQPDQKGVYLVQVMALFQVMAQNNTLS